MNEFEQRLRQVPVKPIPADWRTEILGAARVGQASSLSNERVSASSSRQLIAEAPAIAALTKSFSTKLQAQLSALFWPHPKAWAGLAENSAPPSPEMRVELRQQRQLLVELLGKPEMSDADRPRIKAPQPRTQVVRMMMG